MIDDISYSMSEYWYRKHYHEKIKDKLTKKQKMDIAQRISDLTLRRPIWFDKDIDYSDDFPEIKPYISVPLSGLYLCAIMRGIIEDLQGITDIQPIK